MLTPNDLMPCLYDVFIHILRHGSIDISKLDFNEIGKGDIDNLENVLYNSPANKLFQFSEAFRQFEPAASGRAFI
jgi:hypothetical protein